MRCYCGLIVLGFSIRSGVFGDFVVLLVYCAFAGICVVDGWFGCVWIYCLRFVGGFTFSMDLLVIGKGGFDLIVL